MIYLKQSYDIHPASPATRDRFVTTMQEQVLKANERAGARLEAAWFCHEEWFSKIVHVTAFDDESRLGAYRALAESDPELRDALSQLASLAPEQRVELLEPLGPIPVSSLREGIESSRATPAGYYTFAILEVAPGRMPQFASMLAAIADSLPILACWRDISGNPARVTDLWKGDIGATGYRPNDEGQSAFFEPLREVAPRERLVRLHPLPYSPLQ